ncbi:MAG: decarboxylating NADP(+)-dependent phosphogluconate dehydrogenase [Bacteroidota bacterium]|nr:decarboxylating NADP(+)-dependent phosphogluconate dehydrogenase [Bacteroidota bacterium]
MTQKKADIAVIGIGVMGENLALNFESKGFTTAVFDIDTNKVKHFVEGRANGKKIIGAYSYTELAEVLKQPRKILMMVQAGKAVDAVIDAIVPSLQPGDILIDGGNTHFPDTTRRVKALEQKGLLFVGTGVSGGEEGALLGPAIMPGGSVKAWEHVKAPLQAISAKVGGVPCCDWLGEDGAGHFVKMVHNGIEYGDMQLICETYQMMKTVLGLSNEEMHEAFKDWNNGELKSYLIEITRDILRFKDSNGNAVVDTILDKAGQKGTGKWTVVTALDTGTPLTLITESVLARCLSALKDERVFASKKLYGPTSTLRTDKKLFIDELKKSLYLAKIISYAQGFNLMRAAAKEFKWNLNFGGIALIWRGGCIIRSVFLNKINEAFVAHHDLENLLLDPFFNKIANEYQQSLRTVVAEAAQRGVWIPALSSALMYYDGYRTETLPHNLLQAQRDYFGAHQYERNDKPRGEFFHTNWTGRGGETASTVYNV